MLPIGKTCFYGGVTGSSGRCPNLCGCVRLAVVAGQVCLLLRSCAARRIVIVCPSLRPPDNHGYAGHGFGVFPGFKLASNSAASSGLIIATLAIRGPRDTNAEFSFGGGVTSLAGTMVGVGFAATADAL